MNNSVLTSSDVASIVLYIKRRFGLNYYGLEPNDILNETILYMLETGREVNPSHICSSTFYAVATKKKRFTRYISILNSNKLKLEEQLRQETYSFVSFTVDTQKKPDKVLCITTGLTFKNIRQAAMHYKIDAGNLSRCINGNKDYPSVGTFENKKLKWRYT